MSKVVTLFSLLQLVSLTVTNILPEFNTASIYESINKNKGPSKTFKGNLEEWSDFRTLILQEELLQPTTICVKGIWLIYNQPDFRTISQDDVHLFSGNENCVQPANMSMIGSMQPVGSHTLRNQSITLFEKANFGSFGITFSTLDKIPDFSDFKLQWLPTIESIATFGNISFTLIDTEDRKLCILASFASSLKNPICLIPNLAARKSKDFSQFVRIKMGCGDIDMSNATDDVSDFMQTIGLTNCKEFGGVEMENIFDDGDERGTLSRIETNFQARNKCTVTEPQEINEIVKIFANLRFQHHKSERFDQLLWPERQEDIWKTEILDNIYEIALLTIPKELILHRYLQILREVTFYHLSNVWKLQLAEDISLSTEDVEKVVNQLQECLNFSQEFDIAKKLMDEFNRHTRAENRLQINPVFTRNLQQDIAIETSWLVANYVFGLCNHLNGQNDWKLFKDAIMQLYFTPLSPLGQRWTSQEISTDSYKAILAGLGSEKQFKMLGFVTTEAFSYSQQPPHLSRPT